MRKDLDNLLKQAKSHWIAEVRREVEERAKTEGKIETEEEWLMAFIMVGEERNRKNAEQSIKMLKEKLAKLPSLTPPQERL